MSPGSTRLVAVITIATAAAVGLGSRIRPFVETPVLGTHVGDACWTIAVCGVLRLLRPEDPTARLACLGWALSVAVELSQLLQVGWLETIRANRIGALLIGRGFLWTDLAAYTVGVLLWAGFDAFVRRRRGSTTMG